MYYTIPFGLSLLVLLGHHFSIFLIFLIWQRITEEGSVPEMRKLSILLIKSDLKWCIHLRSRSLFFIYTHSYELMSYYANLFMPLVGWLVGWLFWGFTSLFGWLFWGFYVALAIFHQYRDMEAGNNQSLKCSGETGNRTRTSCSASQELNHYTIASPCMPPDRLIGCILFLSGLIVWLHVCVFVCCQILTFAITFKPKEKATSYLACILK